MNRTVKYGLVGGLIGLGFTTVYHTIRAFWIAEKYKKEGFESCVEERVNELFSYSLANYEKELGRGEKGAELFSDSIGMPEVREEDAKEAVIEWVESHKEHFGTWNSKQYKDHIERMINAKKFLPESEKIRIRNFLKDIERKRDKHVKDGGDPKTFILQPDTNFFPII
jgi:uncharacterized FAD-dependent dehydrogenase